MPEVAEARDGEVRQRSERKQAEASSSFADALSARDVQRRETGERIRQAERSVNGKPSG